jgi:lipopolysaccharide/colanic/teichoic acid biosynthesis glycosyltransferase
MEAGIKNMGHLNPGEIGALYSRMCFHAGSEVAGFILENLSNAELSATPFFANDRNYQEENLKGERLFIDFRDASEVDDLINHFSGINRKIADAGIYIGSFESKYNIQLRLFKKYNSGLSYFILGLNYTFRNFLPMWKRFAKKGKYFISSLYRDNSLAEVLGKQAYCGFEVINYKYYDNLTYFILKKKTEPGTDPVSTSRFFVRLNRVGKKGKMFSIYKLRTMYPFSEFIQDYVVKINGFDSLGKPKNDFRITRLGKIIRKLWIDEIPQFLNLIKGDIRLIGVRPISLSAFSHLPPDLQEKRIRNKPGLIPPQIALRLKGLGGVIKAERQYLEERENHPIRTDIKYFFLAVFNILTFRVKSS